MTILTDTIGEYTAAAGVAIDGLTIKDGGIVTLLNLSKLGTNTFYVDPKGGGAYTTLSAALTAVGSLLTPATDNEVLIVVTGEVAETAAITALDHVHVLFLAGASVTVTSNSTINAVNMISLTNTVWAAVDSSRPHIIRAGTVALQVQGVVLTSCGAGVRLASLYVQNATTGAPGSCGIYNVTNSSPTMTNCTAVAGAGGASSHGIYNISLSNPTMTNCTGIGGSGGASCYGINNYNGSSPVMTGCTGIGGAGGTGCRGIANTTSSNPTMTGCTGIGGGALRTNASGAVTASSRQEDAFQPTASHPYRVTGLALNVSAAAAGGVTLTLRDTTGGGGNALTAATAVSTTGYKYIPITGHRVITAGNNVFAYLSASDATLAYTWYLVYEVAYDACNGLYHDTDAAVVIQDCSSVSNAASSAVYVGASGDDRSKFFGGSARSGLNDAGRSAGFVAAASWNPAQIFGMTIDGGTTNIIGGSWVNATTNKLVGGGGIIAPSIAPLADSTTAIQLQNAAGTNILNVDSTNSRVGIGTTAPGVPLEISSDGAAFTTNVGTYGALFGARGKTTYAGKGIYVVANETSVGIFSASSADSLVFGTRIAPTNFERMRISGAGNVGIGTTAPAALLHVDQSSTTGAVPVLLLDQGDDSEEMIEFTGAVGTGNAIEAVGAKTLTTTHFIKATITGVGTVYIPVGTIA